MVTRPQKTTDPGDQIIKRSLGERRAEWCWAALFPRWGSPQEYPPEGLRHPAEGGGAPPRGPAPPKK